MHPDLQDAVYFQHSNFIKVNPDQFSSMLPNVLISGS